MATSFIDSLSTYARALTIAEYTTVAAWPKHYAISITSGASGSENCSAIRKHYGQYANQGNEK